MRRLHLFGYALFACFVLSRIDSPLQLNLYHQIFPPCRRPSLPAFLRFFPIYR